MCKPKKVGMRGAGSLPSLFQCKALANLPCRTRLLKNFYVYF